MKEPKAKTIYRPLEELHELARNPRKIKKSDLDKLKRSIKDNPDFFEARPIILSDRTGELVVLAGNQRLRAAHELGLKEVPTVLLPGLTEEREREIIIRDNVNNGEWDMDLLANEWDCSDLNDWGVKDIKPMAEIEEDIPDPVDDEGEPDSVEGRIYKLGDHRILCGSFGDSERVKALFGGHKATCTFTDPPYNVAVKNRSTGKTIKNDSMDEDKFQKFLDDALLVIAENMVPGGGCISWMSDKEVATLVNAFAHAGIGFKTIICWVKDHFTLGGGDFQSAKEIAVYGLNEGKFDKEVPGDDTDDFEYAVYGRGKAGKFTTNRKLSNVWFFPKPLASKDHPTMKPIGLCAKGVLAMSDPEDIVFDPFSGSGSTMIACEQTGRVCYGCELDPRYCDVIRKRYYKFMNGSDEGWQDGDYEDTNEGETK